VDRRSGRFALKVVCPQNQLNRIENSGGFGSLWLYKKSEKRLASPDTHNNISLWATVISRLLSDSGTGEVDSDGPMRLLLLVDYNAGLLTIHRHHVLQLWTVFLHIHRNISLITLHTRTKASLIKLAPLCGSAVDCSVLVSQCCALVKLKGSYGYSAWQSLVQTFRHFLNDGRERKKNADFENERISNLEGLGDLGLGHMAYLV